ncbi:MAG TPA: galactosyltransferase-related protein [Dysgonomonas sp.]|uniref:galactosyltransferase-related protein n=1 Tax=Dysgonomonas TaxID=156973 RepID=UPI0025BD49F3|nr:MULTISPECIES: galactosyltransferase-related protein [Dysgonomonas]MBS5908313.1 hypothetical protein [Dysgonomonas mossii]HML64693.1 galactosyltransferase-related protein [Dysgonomonas sp.]
MKNDLTDITFLILIRLDSIHRLENILIVTKQLCRYFNTNIVVRESDSYNNGILESLLNTKINYEFIEDKDPILYKTKHFNQLVLAVDTPFIAIWDADIIPDKKAIIGCMEQLRNNEADIAYPYNGICYDIPKSIRSLYLRKKDFQLLFRHLDKMDRLYPYTLAGGAVMMDQEKFIQAGGENEVHYGWGNDDFDRYERFKLLEYKLYRINTCLFHLCHPRTRNSTHYSEISRKISEKEIFKIKSS